MRTRSGRRALAGLLAALAALAPATASAQVVTNAGALQPVPNGANVSVLRPSAVNVTWTIRAGGVPGTRITSTIGLFKERNGGTTTGVCDVPANATAGETLGQINAVVTTVIGNNGLARVVETLIIPSTISERALRRGLDTFFYCRVFTNPQGATIWVDPAAPTTTATTLANTVTCKQSSSAGANFSIARAEVFFDDRRRTATVPLGTQDLKVFADVAYNGSGLLRAVWEIGELAASSSLGAGPVNAPPNVFTTPVDPNQTPPRTAFRTLHTIAQYIGFGDRVLLTLPSGVPVPTNQPGTFVLNIRFVDPPVGFEIPPATYFVKSNEVTVRRAAITALTPPDAQVMPYATFGFRWESIPGVSQYRIDVFPAETIVARSFPGLIEGPRTNPSNEGNVFNRAPSDLSGDRETAFSALLPSGMTAFNLRQGHLTRLVAGRAYSWQVKGLDARGNVVGESPVRQFTLAPPR